MKYIFVFTLVALAIVALTGKRGARRQYYAIAALCFMCAFASFGNYNNSYIRRYKAHPLQVMAIGACSLVIGGLALRIALGKKK